MRLFPHPAAMLPADLGPVYRLGRVVLTPNARARLSDQDLAGALLRHLRRAWGQTGRRRRRPHLDGCRLLSVHQTGNGLRVWIITEANHDLTTVLLTEDFC